MNFDPSAPAKLKKSQKWFASIITRPIDEDSRMNPISPVGELMEEEAWDYIKPSHTLRPAQRIEIYNQQYWWRLLSILHDTFPLLTRLFGYHDFNQTIAFPYLQKHPPNHWSLNELGMYLTKWIAENYHRSDNSLIKDSAEIDWAYNRTFLAPESPPLNSANLPNPEDLSGLLECTLYLQPSINLFAYTYDLFTFRSDFLKHEPEYWVENDFPELNKKNQWVVLFRNHRKDLIWEEISESEFHLINHFQNGASIEEACQWLEEQKTELYTAASENIHTWLQGWVIKKWLTMEKPKA
ncbi:MAG: putative DNA-binding domain-containing protein [Parachlamydiaceae bacterium]|nr:putative DNA-binding domain-containing protein [Parachlamydiaceae bacterium]